VADSAIAIAADVRAGRRRARDVLEQHLAQISAREFRNFFAVLIGPGLESIQIAPVAVD